MIAVIAHLDPQVADEVTAVLERAGATVHVTPPGGDAVEACRRTRPDVLMTGDAGPGGALALLDRIKADADLFRTAVIRVAPAIDGDGALEWLQRGGDDILRLPVDQADAIGRAFAAARTKALVKELTAQNRRLEELVFFDELTGLRNRRAIFHELELLLAGARRHGHDLSVLMLDLDRFKQVNDRHGHRAGDEVLREVARRLLARLRQADVAGRLGGDELLVVLPETGSDGAANVADSIRRSVTETPVMTTAGSIEVTVSIGSACWEDDEDADALLERADGALYAAKAAGRDRATAA